jgi:hypothetical protein
MPVNLVGTLTIRERMPREIFNVVFDGTSTRLQEPLLFPISVVTNSSGADSIKFHSTPHLRLYQAEPVVSQVVPAPGDTAQRR